MYAVGKRDHEELTLAVGHAYGIPATALRFFNVYGTRQALSNPYTGVAAIFSSRLLNGRPPVVFEDGLQSRDFVSVADLVRAVRAALEPDAADGEALNVGTGRSVSVLDVARTLVSVLNVDVEPEVRHGVRAGDIRHCYANASRAKELLGWEARTTFEDGMARLAQWRRPDRRRSGGPGDGRTHRPRSRRLRAPRRRDGRHRCTPRRPA